MCVCHTLFAIRSLQQHWMHVAWGDLANCDAPEQVLLRPGPYICGEWDFGGFPWWLASSKAKLPPLAPHDHTACCLGSTGCFLSNAG